MTSLHDELEKKLQDSKAAPISFPLQFLKSITGDFSTESELGRGGFGVVYKGVLPSGKIIAVKKLFEIHLVDDKTFKDEVASLMQIKHQHVVQFIGYCAESSWETIKQPSGDFIWAEIPKRLLCFEYLCNKSLEKYISVPIDDSPVLEWKMRYAIIKGICNGLNFLHEECRMVHLDLKPENILMDATMMPKIADFGLSRIFNNQQSRIFTNNSVGSRGYVAPEYLIQGIITLKADIFSLGVLIIEIITGRRDYPYFQLESPESTATSCQHFIEEVHGYWRYKFESTAKYISTEKYNQQVIQCIAIALKCVDPSMEKRPMVNDVIQVLNAVDQMEAKKEMPSEMQSNIKTSGALGDVEKFQECLLAAPLWRSTTSSRKHQEAPKESSEPQRASDKTSECTDNLQVINSIATMDLTPQRVTGENSIKNTYGKLADEAKFDESLSPTPTCLAQEFSEPLSAPDKTDTEVILGSSSLLDVYPPELSFHFKDNCLFACSLNLTNNRDEHVIFGLMMKSDEHTCVLSSLPLFGIVNAGTNYTLVVTMRKYRNLPRARKVALSLQTTTYSGILSNSENITDTCIEHFQKAEELGNVVHKVTLRGVCAPQGDTAYEHSIHPSIKIISMWEWPNICSMDANQTESMIITVHSFGGISRWNYDTQKSVASISIPKGSAGRYVKFIARKGWFLVESNDGFIHVYKYKKEMQKITSFRTHKGISSSLAIHPTQPYVLSSCNAKIKLWDWDHGWFGWKHKKTFKGHSERVRDVAFNPEDSICFASASDDGTIKVWSLDSPKSKYSLSGHSHCVNSLDFFTHDGQQYLITGADDKTAKIWDMREKCCVRTLPHRSEVRSVLPHPKLPLIVTGTKDGDVYFWSSTNFRLKRILNIDGLSWVQGLACLNEWGRVAVAHGQGVSVIEIRDEEEGGGSSSNNENSISPTN